MEPTSDSNHAGSSWHHSFWSATGIGVWLVVLWLPRAFGYSSDASSIARNFSRTATPMNSGIIITANFTNGTSLPLRGFYYVDQLPSALSVTTLNVLLNGVSVTNYMFETGMDGDVYAGCTPARWILEQPPDFPQTNPVPAGAWVQVVYSVSAPASGNFTLAEFEWAGLAQSTTNASFGYGEIASQQRLTFLPPAVLSGRPGAGGWTLQIDSEPGYNYILQASSNLSTWVPLVTNTTPFSFTDTNSSAFPWRFYRGVWVP